MHKQMRLKYLCCFLKMLLKIAKALKSSNLKIITTQKETLSGIMEILYYKNKNNNNI